MRLLVRAPGLAPFRCPQRSPAGTRVQRRGTLIGWRCLKTRITAVTSLLFTTAASASTLRPARRGSWRCWSRCDRVRNRPRIGLWQWPAHQELTAAGHRVIATDASPAMLEMARSYAPAAEDIRTLVLPGDPCPRPMPWSR